MVRSPCVKTVSKSLLAWTVRGEGNTRLMRRRRGGGGGGGGEEEEEEEERTCGRCARLDAVCAETRDKGSKRSCGHRDARGAAAEQVERAQRDGRGSIPE
ncbi:unnamed protein product [Pleuronectes platessa]|uniref:Uncharacterized protein n=1 Tax=Pleuronectes platessa TaxID=8262 RepID=A0A9N7VQ96_PLEPL|nr:unnamed protein product [Pleuronectes platessa]